MRSNNPTTDARPSSSPSPPPSPEPSPPPSPSPSPPPSPPKPFRPASRSPMPSKTFAEHVNARARTQAQSPPSYDSATKDSNGTSDDSTGSTNTATRIPEEVQLDFGVLPRHPRSPIQNATYANEILTMGFRRPSVAPTPGRTFSPGPGSGFDEHEHEHKHERRGSESAWLTREGHDTRNWNYGCIPYEYDHSTRPSFSESLASDDRAEVDADGWPILPAHARRRTWGSETFGALGGGSDVSVDGFTGFKEAYAKYVVGGKEAISVGDRDSVAPSPMQRQSNAGASILTDRTTSTLSSHHFSEHASTGDARDPSATDTTATQTNPASDALFGDYNWGDNHLVGPQSQARTGRDSLVSPDALISLGRTNLEPESERQRSRRAPSKFQNSLVEKHDPRVKAGPLEIHVCSSVEESRDGALKLGWAWVEEKEMKGVSFMEM